MANNSHNSDDDAILLSDDSMSNGDVPQHLIIEEAATSRPIAMNLRNYGNTSLVNTNPTYGVSTVNGIIDLCGNTPSPPLSPLATAVSSMPTNNSGNSAPRKIVPNDRQTEAAEVAINASEEVLDSDIIEIINEPASTSNVASNTVYDCPICLQTCIHPARLPCGHIFCFLCVKGVAYKNRRCAMCRREIPPEFLDNPQLVNGIDDICSNKTTEDGYQWFYEGRSGWWQYDDRTSQDIEEAYKKGDKSCTILVAGYVYIVDLEAMVQQRQNEPTRCRRVKRDLATVPKKGVAGLRIEGNMVTTDTDFAAQVYRRRRQLDELGSTGSIEADLNMENLDLSIPAHYGLSLRLPGSASDFISTIAATDAAIRIASDIIGSTLAHADELSRSGNSNSISSPSSIASGDATNDLTHSNGENRIYRAVGGGVATPSSPTINEINVSNLAAELNAVALRSSRELLGAAEDLLDATQNVILEADQRTIDLFEQTLNDFHELTLRNIIDDNNEANINDVDHNNENYVEDNVDQQVEEDVAAINWGGSGNDNKTNENYANRRF